VLPERDDRNAFGVRVAEEELDQAAGADASGKEADDRIRVLLEALVGARERIETTGIPA
jgi:hypothetical protein